MTVSEVMSPDVASVLPTTPIGEVRDLMRQNRFHHLVVERGGHTVGIVSTHDLDRTTPSRRRAKTVADVMTRHVVTVDERASVDRASYVMRGHSIGCLVVLRRGQAVGIVTASDLLGLLGNRVRHGKRADTRTAIHHRVGHRHRSRADGIW
jgi:CBS domain-containing protein